jgi:hypothetical protein
LAPEAGERRPAFTDAQPSTGRTDGRLHGLVSWRQPRHRATAFGIGLTAPHWRGDATSGRQLRVRQSGPARCSTNSTSSSPPPPTI